MSSGGGGSSAASKTINKISTGAAGSAQGLNASMPGQNLGQQYLPQFQQQADVLAGVAGGPLGGQLMGGARQAADYGARTAGDVSGFAQGLIPYAQRIGEMGFDPQQALYDRTLHQVQEQQRAGQAARGISMSPYGAGLEGDATRNFNIDWQNQQLKRATDAAGAMEGLGSSAFNLGSGATDLAASASRLPYMAQTGLVNDKYNAYANVGSQVMGANQPRQQVISNYMTAAGLGPAYSQAAAQAQQAGTNQMSSLASIPLSLIGKH